MKLCVRLCVLSREVVCACVCVCVCFRVKLCDVRLCVLSREVCALRVKL